MTLLALIGGPDRPLKAAVVLAAGALIWLLARAGSPRGTPAG
jgi:hypothetical protein